jgi:uncharacterized protein (TIGR02246 family)
MTQFKNTFKLKFHICLLILLSILVVNNFAQSVSHEQYINKAYQEWVKATNSKDIEKWSSFLAEDAIFHPPDHPALVGDKAIKDYYIGLFKDKLFSLKCKQESVEISKSEDLAWATGSCEATFTGPDGKAAHGKSKWVKVWVRLQNGEWRCKINSWSSSIKN